MKDRILKRRILLNKRVEKLKRTFDFKQSITGANSIQQDKLRSLILLCHSEIEDYFEGVATLVFQNAKNKWNTKHISNYNMSYFLVRYSQKLDKVLPDINNEIFELDKKYEKEIDDNHGIKRKNILNMFRPLGYNEEDFPLGLLESLDSFGVGRGKIAHVASYKAQNALDKTTVYAQINNIITQLAQFEIVIISKL